MSAPSATNHPRLETMAAQTTRIATLSQWLVVAAVVLLAILPRAVGPVVLTPDEAEFWRERIGNFAVALETGNLIETQQTHHPGVITMWLGTIGRAIDRSIYGPDHYEANPLAYFAMLRLPIIIFHALCIGASYALLRRLISPAVALLTALFWCFDPFVIANSQILHTDAMTMSLSFLTILVVIVALQPKAQEPARTLPVRWAWWLGAAVLFALSVLAKLNGVVLAGVIGLYPLLRDYRHWRNPTWWLTYVKLMVAFALVSVAAFVVFHPAMWVDPVGVVTDMFTRANLYSQAGHFQFYFGEVSRDPGPTHYFVTTAFRLTPFVSLGLLLGVVALVRRQGASYRDVLLALGVYVAVFFVVTTLQPKKFDRYLLPIFPALFVFASIGFVWLAKLAGRAFDLNSPWTKFRTFPVIIYAAVAVLLATQVAAAYPYMLAYFNPLLGGLDAAQHEIPVGWGEGLDQAGAYIQEITGGNCRYVIGEHPDVVQGYTNCRVIRPSACAYQVMAEDPTGWYAYLYIDQLQRQAMPELTAAAEFSFPLRTFYVDDVAYAEVYRVGDLDLDILRQAGSTCER